MSRDSATTYPAVMRTAALLVRAVVARRRERAVAAAQIAGRLWCGRRGVRADGDRPVVRLESRRAPAEARDFELQRVGAALARVVRRREVAVARAGCRIEPVAE